jgi:hypothetical protein
VILEHRLRFLRVARQHRAVVPSADDDHHLLLACEDVERFGPRRLLAGVGRQERSEREVEDAAGMRCLLEGPDRGLHLLYDQPFVIELIALVEHAGAEQHDRRGERPALVAGADAAEDCNRPNARTVTVLIGG